MKWREVILNEICTSQYGYTASAEEQNVGLKFLRITDIVPETINWLSVPYCAIDEEDIKKYKLEKGDIVIARTGNTTGYAKLIRDDVDAVFASYLIRLRVNPLIANPQYIGRLIESKIYKSFVNSIKGGSAQGNANAKMLTLFKFKIPHLPIQQKIADILSKYDDLIENNRRRIELLERSARLLYKEWFVRLRFPGHEHTPIIDGIPEGWERLKLSDLCEVKRGASPRPINNYMGGTVPWFKIGDATKSESPFIFETVELVTEDGARQSVFLEPLSLILSNSATCGIPFFTGLHGCIHDGWLCFKNFQGISKYFLYCYLLFKQRELLQSVGDGSTQKNLNTKIVEKLDIIIPNNGVILKLFDNFVNPAFTMILTLAIQNMKLRKARDILLPKLMNGEIEV
ncbi:restriction endonuclease subunit S [Microcystis aeruginosa]|uniref:restriction endonuclease subunit S n=1 Tax=Microcystis aeruginosa TaxID=1126 RepID=UPI00233115AD|nr:restriction endonuclease subunit S [Microcystis aeruginosa]MDB9415395.1 restriction endonuclease subunit S [Microcystis aeruginosa CS-556/03]